MHLNAELFRELKNGIEILVDQAVKWIKTVKMLFRSITQEPLVCEPNVVPEELSKDADVYESLNSKFDLAN